MPKPIIALSLAYYDVKSKDKNKYHVNENYIEAIKKAGGIPLLLPILDGPELKQLLSHVSGILLTGGGGLLPHVDKEQLPSLYEQNPRRHVFEKKLVDYARQRTLPLMGICRGMQVINEVFGGSLYHQLLLITKENHYQSLPRSKPSHSVKLIKDSRLYKVFENETIEVNSFHNQAINTLGKGLKAVAFSEDGVLEAYENDENEAQFISGFQFHPEALLATNKSFLKIFTQFIEVAGGRDF